MLPVRRWAENLLERRVITHAGRGRRYGKAQSHVAVHAGSSEDLQISSGRVANPAPDVRWGGGGVARVDTGYPKIPPQDIESVARFTAELDVLSFHPLDDADRQPLAHPVGLCRFLLQCNDYYVVSSM